MAQMLPGFNVIGSISNISAYKRRGSDKIYVRTKGGAKKEKIKRSPSFEKTRKINAEFGGRSTTSKWIMQALLPQKALADYNIAGPLNALLKPIQQLDIESEPGKRSICLSSNPKLLEGFNLNQHYPFDTVVRNPLVHSISRETVTATVSISSLLPGINFRVPYKYPFYSFIVTLGTVPDLFFNENGYRPSLDFKTQKMAATESDWHPVLNGSPAITLEVNSTDDVLMSSSTLILSVGIRFGTVTMGGQIEQVKNAGSAKIIAAV